MIAYLEGELIAKGASHTIIQVGGVGYQVFMSTPLLSSLPVRKKRVAVWIKMIVREDDIALYGFDTEPQREFFEKLMTVSGVGPKVALAALSTFDSPQIAAAIEAEDVVTLATIPGIGRKVAQRIILELKGKLGFAVEGVVPVTSDSQVEKEATEALLSMGFSPTEARTSLEGYAGSQGDVGALVTYALKRLGQK